MVGPKFEQKSSRILKFIIYNGPTHKKTIEERITPPIDKPTIYKAIRHLESAKLVVVRRREKGGMVKYYQATPRGVRGMLYDKYGKISADGKWEKGKWIPEEEVLKILEANAYDQALTPGKEWIETVRSLEPYIRDMHEGLYTPNLFLLGSALLYLRDPNDDFWGDLRDFGYRDKEPNIEIQTIYEFINGCLKGTARFKPKFAKQEFTVVYPLRTDKALVNLRDVLKTLEKHPRYRAMMLKILDLRLKRAIRAREISEITETVIKTVLADNDWMEPADNTLELAYAQKREIYRDESLLKYRKYGFPLFRQLHDNRS